MSGNNINLNISVDCVLIGYDGTSLKVLLVNQTGKSSDGVYNDRKLPGSLIYDNESVDSAARRVLKELTGLENIELHQFRTYGDLERTSNPKDILWLERFMRLPRQVSRIVTVAYFALLKLDSKSSQLSILHNATWEDVKNVGVLAFDHNRIIRDAIKSLRNNVEASPDIYFELLPKRFTMAQFRRLSEVINDTKYDVRNFSRRALALPYIKRTEERESNVSHRAASLYRFDRSEYRRLRK